MQRRVTLPCHAEITIANHHLLMEMNGNEIRFAYGGLSNDPLGDGFPLFSYDYHIEPNAQLYGDGFQMSSQVIGTLNHLRVLGNYPDNGSLMRIYPSSATQRFYNYLIIGDSLGYTLLGFTSCHRFSGYFEVVEQNGRHQIRAYLNGENSLPRDWTTFQLESVVILKSVELNALYDQFIGYIHQHHAPRASVQQGSPVGWSSFQSQTASTDAHTILTNLKQLHQQALGLEYVLIEQGYQVALGDWIGSAESFGAELMSIVDDIRSIGRKPAIWIAPFVASPNSAVFKHHPDWFVHNQNGKPMRADEVTYSGLDGKPCYLLDTTNVDVQEHLFEVIRFLCRELGIEMFKVDGAYWGCVQGERQITGISTIEAYRIGLEVIYEAAEGAFVLLSRAPLWPSLGLADGMRVCDLAVRDARQFESNTLMTLLRSWQHRRLWHIDPERLVLTSLANQGCERRYYDFHRTCLLASGGLLFSGDPLDDITPYAQESIKRLIMRYRHTQVAASFSSLTLSHAMLALTPQNDLHCLFNYRQTTRDVMLTANHPVDWYDYWSGEKLNHTATQALEVTLKAGLFARAIVTVG
ncbi:alpha-galactosidase [Vibrio panuliri]|uniref:Alpha-galactosidase n=1 Tax=Vibrio panuliri TaxID=1381081 RepID=A0A1Q9HE61_9VIBR|nr:alpha-galactosidase [Vibrio panuliri]OLQ87998.1 alpha-galactosidase [Vibrio panuliri]